MIPKQVKIGGINYKIIMREEVILNGETESAYIDYMGQTIVIKNGLGKEYTEAIFLHEILHGVIEMMGVNLDDYDEEDIVTRLAFGLHQVLKDNKIQF